MSGRVLAHAGSGRAPSLAEHVERSGSSAASVRRGPHLIDAIADAGLRGRGGAAFPTATKLRAVAGRRGRRALVVNGAEGEPMSAKDRTLLELAPHLVLDGATLAAEAIGARQAVIAVKRSAVPAHEAVSRALAERRDVEIFRLEPVPDAFLAGEESALLQRLNGGPARPTSVSTRPYQRGLGRQPTLVANVETLAHVALIARHGPAWFRQMGSKDHPGSALVTVGGFVSRPGVYEVALDTPVVDAIAAAGGTHEACRAVLVGGYHGSWLDSDDVSRAARLGAGVVVALPVSACPVAEVARVVRWLADENAQQCGPCVHGLNAIAGAVASIAAGTAGREVTARLHRWARQVERRGACHHPDGVVRFLRSAMNVFADELDDHRRHGPCAACARRSVLTIPHADARLAA